MKNKNQYNSEIDNLGSHDFRWMERKNSAMALQKKKKKKIETVH